MMVKFRTIRFAETATRLHVLGLILFILYACVSGHHKPFIETSESLLWEDRLRMQKTAVEMLIENFAK